MLTILNKNIKSVSFIELLASITSKSLAVLIKISLIISFIVLSSTIKLASANDMATRSIVPIIMLLLEDDTPPFITIGATNDELILNNEHYPDEVVVNFSKATENVIFRFTLGGLQANQSLRIIVNDQLVGEITTNGDHEILISNDFLNSQNINSLEFESVPEDASWQISDLFIFNSEGPYTRAEAVRFLNKATFGANEASINRLLALGYEAWLDEQLDQNSTLHTPFYQEAIVERASVGIEGASQLCAAKMDAWWNGAIKGNDQVRQRMAFALSQIFVIGDAGCNTNRIHGFINYYDILIKNAFGSYRQLIEDVTLNPVMGDWLSLRGSNASPIYGNSADENYAREVMQLFSIGVYELNLDGSLKLNNGKPIETYDNNTITNIARALTGWQRDDSYDYWNNVLYPMVPWAGTSPLVLWHDWGEKTILSDVYIPAGGNVIEDTKVVLDTIAAHDNVAPFISKQLIQRFVTSNPSPEYIARVATVFNDNGSGVKGDLGAVIKAILLDTESLNSHENNDGGKMKEPLLMVSQIWRAFNAQSPIKYIRFMHADRDLGQRPMGADTVFNFYRPDYAPIGGIADKGLVAPEIYLLNDYQLLTFYPKLEDILNSTITLDPEDIIDGKYNSAFNINLQLNLTTAKSLATNTSALMDYFNEILFGGLMTDGLRNLVIDYIENDVVYAIDEIIDSDAWRERKVEEALIILGVSPEFMVQK